MLGTRWLAYGGLVLSLLTAACASGRQAPPQYGYGDMFEDEDRGSYRSDEIRAVSSGGGGGGFAATVDEPMVAESARMRFGGHSRRSSRRGRHEESYTPTEEAPVDVSPPAPMVQRGATTTPDREAAAGPGAPAAVVATTEPADASPESGGQPLGGESGESGGQPPSGESGEAAVAPRRGPLMIYEGGLRLAVQDVRAKIDEVAQLSHEIGGYIVSQSDTAIVIRVPAERFREALRLIEALGDVLDRRISAQDVSEAVRDLRIRLQNAINMRDRLRELLAAAQTVAESLVIERELERLNETIELIRGTLNSLEERIAFSTITVDLQPIQDRQEIPSERFRLPFSWLDELGLANLLQL